MGQSSHDRLLNVLDAGLTRARALKLEVVVWLDVKLCSRAPSRSVVSSESASRVVERLVVVDLTGECGCDLGDGVLVVEVAVVDDETPDLGDVLVLVDNDDEAGDPGESDDDEAAAAAAE